MILSEPVLAENKRYLLMAEIKDKEGEIYPYYLVDKKLYHQRKNLQTNWISLHFIWMNLILKMQNWQVKRKRD